LNRIFGCSPSDFVQRDLGSLVRNLESLILTLELLMGLLRLGRCLLRRLVCRLRGLARSPNSEERAYDRGDRADAGTYSGPDGSACVVDLRLFNRRPATTTQSALVSRGIAGGVSSV
jgi:hypothetical protein